MIADLFDKFLAIPKFDTKQIIIVCCDSPPRSAGCVQCPRRQASTATAPLLSASYVSTWRSSGRPLLRWPLQGDACSQSMFLPASLLFVSHNECIRCLTTAKHVSPADVRGPTNLPELSAGGTRLPGVSPARRRQPACPRQRRCWPGTALQRAAPAHRLRQELQGVRWQTHACGCCVSAPLTVLYRDAAPQLACTAAKC